MSPKQILAAIIIRAFELTILIILIPFILLYFAMCVAEGVLGWCEENSGNQ